MQTRWGRANAAGPARCMNQRRLVHPPRTAQGVQGWIVALSFALAACQGTVTPALPALLPTGTSSPAAPLSTATLVTDGVVQPNAQDAISAAATAGVTAPPDFQTPANTGAERLVQPTAVQPLHFVFPTPIVYSVPSSWRPPVLSLLATG